MKAAAVFGVLSQDELDRAYDQDAWAANGAEVQARIIADSMAVAQRTPPETRRYGPAGPQCIDIFAPKNAQDAPVFILIHGGAWRLSMREAFYGPAPAIVSAGCVLAVVGFECLPAISMVVMAEQIRQAIRWIAREIGAFGGDVRNLNLIGHSSGAHMAAVMLTTDWCALGVDPAAIRGCTLISGLYDLEPVMLSARASYIDLTPAQSVALSPIRSLEQICGKVSLWWGSADSPEFKRQSMAFADALNAVERPTPATELAERNHFEMLEMLSDAASPPMRAMLAAAGC